jgi:hypothetical protein
VSSTVGYSYTPSELDRLCGHAVRSLGRSAPDAVLDVLGALHPDRLAGDVLRAAGWSPGVGAA